MSKVFIGFSSPKKWQPFAWLIQTAYKTTYDHVYIKIEMSEYERILIFQASKTIVNFMSLDVFTSANSVFEEFPLEADDQKRIDLIKFMLDNAGKPYSLTEVLGIAWIKLNSWFGRKVENPYKEGTNQYVCSVCGAYILQNFFGKTLGEDFEDVDPKYLYDFLKSQQKA